MNTRSKSTVASNTSPTDTERQDTAKTIVDQMMRHASITTTTTKAGWCLRQGLLHTLSADSGRLQTLIQSHGLPSFYHAFQSCRKHPSPTDNMIKAPQNCFQSLCRIIAGQQLAGNAAQSIWNRLLETTHHNLTPATILQLTELTTTSSIDALQKPAGLSRAKTRAIIDLAQHFESGQLSEEFLTQSTPDEIRKALLQVKGLGPWSCDMFLMFYLEQPNVFPFGDLGVRKGVAKVFQLGGGGKGPKGSLCPKKDLDRVLALVEPYQPYQSLFTYYMWRAADTPDVYYDASITEGSSKRKGEVNTAVTPAKRGRKVPAVTP